MHLKQFVPHPIKAVLQYCYDAGLDLIDFLGGKRHPKVPPRRHTFIGRGDFIKDGKAFLNTLIELTGLSPDQRVLDIGSGQGRVTLPLSEYLSSKGSYAGLEIVLRGVEWCKKVYAEHPNFSFVHADVHNSYYNPDGKFSGSTYLFPFDDGEFDVVFLTSVFTHMHPEDVAHYLKEISRCLKPGGTCIASFFLLDEQSRDSISRGDSSVSFQYPFGEHALTATESEIENAIAIDQEFIRASYHQSGLRITDVHRGAWSGNKAAISLQDLMLATKP